MVSVRRFAVDGSRLSTRLDKFVMHEYVGLPDDDDPLLADADTVEPLGQ
jgi:hypothetical protein